MNKESSYNTESSVLLLSSLHTRDFRLDPCRGS